MPPLVPQHLGHEDLAPGEVAPVTVPTRRGWQGAVPTGDAAWPSGRPR